mmetsp:Transcript_36111/g.87805  ORF Transcript_36111/g.87805 Transcript_36111/m.87805 type:complete len:226 (-) Transcript_36111:443-1120(-)
MNGGDGNCGLGSWQDMEDEEDTSPKAKGGTAKVKLGCDGEKEKALPVQALDANNPPAREPRFSSSSSSSSSSPKTRAASLPMADRTACTNLYASSNSSSSSSFTLLNAPFPSRLKARVSALSASMSLLRTSTSSSFASPLRAVTTSSSPSSPNRQSSTRSIRSEGQLLSTAASGAPPFAPKLLLVRSSSSSELHASTARSMLEQQPGDSNRWFLMTNRFIDRATV